MCKTSEKSSTQICLIDDNPIVLETLTDMLTASGFNVISFEDGMQALESIRADKPDLVITDLYMPGISGWEVAKQIKEINPLTPVAILTGSLYMNPQCDSRGNGVDMLLTKPISWHHLIQAVQELIGMNMSPAGQ